MLSSLHLTGKYKDHSHLDQSDTDRSSATASESEETLTRLVQRSTRHADGDLHGALAFPEEEAPKENRDGTGDEVPILTPRPQFHDDMSGDEEDPNLASPVRRETERSRGDSLTGAFFRNWQAFDTTYMQPVFGGYSQRPSASTSIDDLADMQLAKAQAEATV